MSLEEAHTHESVQALMGHAFDGETPEDVIRRKSREIIARHRTLWKGPPFCPIQLADLEGVIVEEAPCDIKSDGRIFPKGDKVIIQYAKDQSEERIRFTVCHELAHTLFPDCYKRIRLRSPKERAEWEFEDLCNKAASEFLFPLEEFMVDMPSPYASADQIRDLAVRYKASIDATARRIVHLIKRPACVVFAQYRKPTGKSVTSLSVQYAVANSEFPFKIYKNLRINSKSIANVSYQEQRSASCSLENWNIGGTWGRFRVEALALPKFESKATADVAIMLYP
jgi:Zn-dependent peptidase ImmA (M78 family)